MWCGGQAAALRTVPPSRPVVRPPSGSQQRTCEKRMSEHNMLASTTRVTQEEIVRNAQRAAAEANAQRAAAVQQLLQAQRVRQLVSAPAASRQWAPRQANTHSPLHVRCPPHHKFPRAYRHCTSHLLTTFATPPPFPSPATTPHPPQIRSHMRRHTAPHIQGAQPSRLSSLLVRCPSPRRICRACTISGRWAI